jgi:guanylate kinase
MSLGAPGGVFVVSAPSGAGKTTLCGRLVAGLGGLVFSVSVTTRSPREGERQGVDYHFVTHEEFESRRRDGEFLEWAVVDGQLYGTSAAMVRGAIAQGTDVLLDIDTQGAASVRRLLPEAVLVFIMPPGQRELRERLTRRGTEAPDALARRLALARGEIEKWPLYDYVVVNDDLDAAHEQLRGIVLAARCRRDRQSARAREIAAGFEVP